MKLRMCVVVAALVHCCLDAAGIAVSLLVPPGPHTGSLAWAELHGDRAALHEDTSWLTGEVSTYRDYSRVTPAHPALYLLPHLWAGVIPRMLDGYRCVVADQLVAGHLASWHSLFSLSQRAPGEHVILSLSRMYNQKPRQVETLQKNLDSALEMRRTQCGGRRDTLILLELVFMAASLLVCLATVLATLCSQLHLAYLPWMLVLGFEIAGNLVVAVTFLTSPGLPLLISLVCTLKVIILRWIFVNVVRRQMIRCIEMREKEGSQQVKEDLERKVLRSQLSDKGRVRLARVFGSYS